MSKRKHKKRIRSLKERFRSELKLQQELRLNQFKKASSTWKGELLYRAQWATKTILRVKGAKQ